MPPRKKAKVSSATSPRDSQPKTPIGPLETIEQHTPQATDDLEDPWTDEQETELFKGIIRFKPTGIHKHFHMLSISNSLVSHGITTSSTSHTKIPGIWKKLSSLYDLAALDEREYTNGGWSQPDTKSELDSPEEEEESELVEFSLPSDEYGEMMWQRRFAPSPSTSEPEIPDIAPSKEDQPPTRLSPSVVIDIVGPQAAKRGTKSSRSVRGRPAAGRTRTVSGTKAGRGNRQETSQDEIEEESVKDDEEEEDEDESASVPARRGRAVTKSEKPVGKGTARRSARKR